jgi:membrane protein
VVAGQAAEPRQLGARLARFAALVVRQAHEDSVALTASALAFVTILSIIPLLAAISFVGARVFTQYPEHTLEVFVQILPYSDHTLVEKIGEFLTQAESLHGFGLLVFFSTALLAFGTVEETLNQIWNVSRRRPLRARLLSFTLLLFWGPLLLGATFSSLLLLRQSPAAQRVLADSVLLAVLPFVAAVVGLTTLYWLVPYTAVRLPSALAGGLTAALLLELLRLGFGSYVRLSSDVNAVYGSFAFALLFMISLQLAWTLVLLGGEVAYTAQHFRRLSASWRREAPLQASWVGLALLCVITDRFLRGEPPLPYEELADHLHLSARELDRVLHPLLTHELVREMPGGAGCLLATDPHRLPIERVFRAYDHRARRGIEPVGGPLRQSLEALVARLAEARTGALGPATLADLLEQPLPGAP